jgi:hypothetical protein
VVLPRCIPALTLSLAPAPRQLTIIEHGQTVAIAGLEGARIMVRATPGDRVGPPWQARENGYVVSSTGPAFSLYYEPHCKFEDISKDEKVRAG